MRQLASYVSNLRQRNRSTRQGWYSGSPIWETLKIIKLDQERAPKDGNPEVDSGAQAAGPVFGMLGTPIIHLVCIA